MPNNMHTHIIRCYTFAIVSSQLHSEAYINCCYEYIVASLLLLLCDGHNHHPPVYTDTISLLLLLLLLAASPYLCEVTSISPPPGNFVAYHFLRSMYSIIPAIVAKQHHQHQQQHRSEEKKYTENRLVAKIDLYLFMLPSVCGTKYHLKV